MKLVLVFISVYQLFALSTPQEIDQLFDDIIIHKIDNSEFKKLEDPFNKYSKKSKKRKYSKTNKHITIHLQTIINKSAKINNKWFQKGDSIKGYKILEIKSNKIKLSKKSKIFNLKIEDKI